jgi:hypothetical protein
MIKTSRFLFLNSIFLSAGCMGQVVVEPPFGYRKECSFTYRSPLMGDFSNGKFEIFDEALFVDVPRGILGSLHASVGVPECDHGKWHCLSGVAAPLYLPKPFSKDLKSWGHGDYFYQIGDETSLLSRHGTMVTPVFVYEEKIRAKEGLGKSSLRAAYLFDMEMNLVGFSSYFPDVEGNAGTIFVNAYWLEGDQAPLDCY